MKQLILITDGCSNVGMDPVAAAVQARNKDIRVNVIGMTDDGEFGRRGEEEVEAIARAGGGMSRLVKAVDLSRTVQMMTRKTVLSTVREAVSVELQEVFQTADIEQLSPSRRAKAVGVMDKLTDSLPMRVALLIDASASMKPKLQAVEEAVYDLMLSLQSRAGVSELAVLHFPGRSHDETAMDLPWTRQFGRAAELFKKLHMRGATPTGPAILHTIPYFQMASVADQEREQTVQQAGLCNEASDEEGMYRDYIV
ncbi:hypothetical protein [Marinicrinis sediminis]|uniref:VWFA domain-containing protein n=1 Tax=Marinicrinis sediminis TaxID=1652465 RepID=A0ABW5R9T0_9BACL